MALMRHPVILDAPSNLGLRPPSTGTVPGVYKLPWALRDAGLAARIGAADAGAVVPPRYDPAGWRPGDGVRQADRIAAYSFRLADRVAALLDNGRFPVVLGGDCSILLGPALALRRRGRFGLAYVDGADFRHPGNAEFVGAAGGEALALATGRGQADLTDMDGLRPYVRDEDAVLIGVRDEDEMLGEVRSVIPVVTAAEVSRSAAAAATEALEILGADRLDGFWLHVDADVLDPSVMPAVDAPDPGGLGFGELRDLLRPLLASPACQGMQVTIFDPDLDADGSLAEALTDTLVEAFDDAS